MLLLHVINHKAMEYKLFNFQRTLESIRNACTNKVYLKKYLETIPADARLEDMHFYKNYLSRINLKFDLDIDILAPPIFKNATVDYELLQKLVLGSPSIDCEFLYDEYEEGFTLSMLFKENDITIQRNFDELSKKQIMRVFYILIEEQLTLDALRADAEKRASVDKFREEALLGIDKSIGELRELFQQKGSQVDVENSMTFDETNIRVVIKDRQGVGNAFINEGYEPEQVESVKRRVMQDFHDAAIKVFSETLNRELPKTIEIRWEKSKESSTLASFNSIKSNENHFVFSMYKKAIELYFIKMTEEFWSMVMHEMVHAADLFNIDHAYRLYDEIQNKIDSSSNAENSSSIKAQMALLEVLEMLQHYREEGIAILCGNLLSKRDFNAMGQDEIHLFRKMVELSFQRSILWITDPKYDEVILDNEVSDAAYSSAYAIVGLVLLKRGDINDVVFNKINKSMGWGYSEMTQQEIRKVVRAALSLSLSDFIQGLMLWGDKIAPLKPLLEFCGLLQNEYSPHKIESFMELLQKPVTETTFLNAMQSIADSLIPEEQLNSCCANFCQNSPDDKLKAKVMQLHQVMSNEDNSDLKRIAQWALSYLFSEKDLIHDDTTALGYVDDAIVIDLALKAMKKVM